MDMHPDRIDQCGDGLARGECGGSGDGPGGGGAKPVVGGRPQAFCRAYGEQLCLFRAFRPCIGDADGGFNSRGQRPAGRGPAHGCFFGSAKDRASCHFYHRGMRKHWFGCRCGDRSAHCSPDLFADGAKSHCGAYRWLCGRYGWFYGQFLYCRH